VEHKEKSKRRKSKRRNAESKGRRGN